MSSKVKEEEEGGGEEEALLPNEESGGVDKEAGEEKGEGESLLKLWEKKSISSTKGRRESLLSLLPTFSHDASTTTTTICSRKKALHFLLPSSPQLSWRPFLPPRPSFSSSFVSLSGPTKFSVAEDKAR